MINLTYEIMVIKSGSELTEAVKHAITLAKNCVRKELFNDRYIAPSKITSSTRNEFYSASIFRLFENHLGKL